MPTRPFPVTNNSQPSLSAQAPIPFSITDITKKYAEACRTLKALGSITITAQWIKPQANNGQGRFFTVTLADTEDPKISMQGIIWNTQEAETLLQEGTSFGINLLDRTQSVEVIIEGTLEYWLKQSKPYIAIKKLSQTGMLGLKHQQRKQALEKLQAENLLNRNASLLWTTPTLRLLLITKEGSDAHRDALSILTASPYRLCIDLFPISVQGVGAVNDIERAFRHLHASSSHYDAVLLIRGGGGELDLLAFEDYRTARAVAECPLPCITGIGHQADHSLCDVVAYRHAGTPTAAAQFIVAQLDELAHHLTQARQRIATQSLRHLTRHHQHLQLVSQRINQRLPQLMQQHQHRLEMITKKFIQTLTLHWASWRQHIQEVFRQLEPFAAETWQRLGIAMARSLDGHIISRSTDAPLHTAFWLYFADKPLLVTRPTSSGPGKGKSRKRPKPEP